MKKFCSILANICSTFITLPIWFYLLYKILIKVEATELMMFLFWIYLPVTFIITLIIKILEIMGNSEK